MCVWTPDRSLPLASGVLRPDGVRIEPQPKQIERRVGCRARGGQPQVTGRPRGLTAIVVVLRNDAGKPPTTTSGLSGANVPVMAISGQPTRNGCVRSTSPAATD